jgi:hypothetical protein
VKQKLRSVALVRIPGGTLLFCAMHHCTVACASILSDGVSRSRFSGLYFIPLHSILCYWFWFGCCGQPGTLYPLIGSIIRTGAASRVGRLIALID